MMETQMERQVRRPPDQPQLKLEKTLRGMVLHLLVWLVIRDYRLVQTRLTKLDHAG